MSGNNNLSKQKKHWRRHDMSKYVAIHQNIAFCIILSLLLVLLTQVSYLPIVVSVSFAACITTLWWFFKKQKHVPKLLTYLLASISLIAIYIQHQSFLGVDAGVAVLATFLFAKALESKNRRDVVILFNFALFVAASSFLFSQSFFMAMMVLLCLLSCLLGLYRIQTTAFEQQNHEGKIAFKQDVTYVSKFLLLALPFFLLLFIFFPRLPPLWHIPIPENKATTGINDSMSPGDIAELSQSSALAFRILGDLKYLPPRQDLYWRALVLDEYDGQTWTSNFVNQQPLNYTATQMRHFQKGWDYQYLAADPAVIWVMGLETSIPLERRYYNRHDWGLMPYRLTQRVEPIPLRWIGQTIPEQHPNQDYIERLNTKTIRFYDPKAQQLAEKLWQGSGQQPEVYIRNVLNWYKDNRFAYTLTPGTLGQNRIDEFLFESKKGFCEHYASSFVMLMRYVGIPARVVTGYQGGQFAPDKKSWEVRQLDAHAWAEVLIDHEWQRIDPTAIVAPERIDTGMQDFMQQDRNIFGEHSTWNSQNYALLTKLRIWSDYASFQWQSKVVGYNAESQKNWLTKLGLSSVYSLIVILIISMIALVVFFILWPRIQRYYKQDPLLYAIQKFNQRLKLEQQKQNAETFKQWLFRLQQHYSALIMIEDIVFLTEVHAKMTYANMPLSSQEIEKFKYLLKCYTDVLKSV